MKYDVMDRINGVMESWSIGNAGDPDQLITPLLQYSNTPRNVQKEPTFVLLFLSF